MRFFLSSLLLLSLLSCSNTVVDLNDDFATNPKVAPSLLKKINGGTVFTNSGEQLIKVGVLYKKQNAKRKISKSRFSLIDVEFKDLSSDEILSLSKDPDVEIIEEDQKVKVDLIFASKQIGARDAWVAGYTGDKLGGTATNIRLAVVDTGLDEDHLDFSDAGKIVLTANCYNVNTCTLNNQNDDHGHGSHVAGIVLGGGNSCVGDDFYIEFEETFPDINIGNRHFFPAQFDSNPSSGGTLKVDSTWVGNAGTKAIAGFMTEEEALEDDPVFLFDEEKPLLASGPSVSPATYADYTAYNITAQDSYIKTFVFSTYVAPSMSSLVGKSYWSRVKSTAQGWGDAFSRTAGISNDSQIVAVKALGSDGSGNISDVVRALDYVSSIAEANNIIAVNLSFSLGGGVNSEIINSIVTELVDKGVSVVVSAGNEQQGGSVIGSPGTTPYAVTVGAVNEKNEVTNYTSIGSINNDVIKPDVVAPGGSVKGINDEAYERLGIVSAKTTYNVSGNPNNYSSWWNTTQGLAVDPYTTKIGTSQAAPMVTGLIGLMASKRQGAWSFNSSELPRTIKNIICMSAFETGAREESTFFNEAPITPERAGGLKDRVEGYGRVCTQGALSAFDAVWNINSNVNSDTFTFGDEVWDQKTFIRRVTLSASKEYTFSMAVPSGTDFDMYLFSGTPDENGEPVLLASSALMNSNSRPGPERIIDFIPTTNGTYYIVAKWISGSGTTNFTLESSRTKPAEPVVISNFKINRDMRAKRISVSWDTNIATRSILQYGSTGGLEEEQLEENAYTTSHEHSFSIEYDNYYYLRALSSSSGSNEASISTAVSPVYRVSAVTQLSKDITIEDLPLVDVGGCGTIKSDHSGNPGNGNLFLVLLPIAILFFIRSRRMLNDKGLQFNK